MAGVNDYLSMRPRLYNPCWQLLAGSAAQSAMGTFFYGGEWFVLDQILCSRGLLVDSPIRLVKESVRAVAMESGKPASFDPTAGTGVSDHLPLVCEIELD